MANGNDVKVSKDVYVGKRCNPKPPPAPKNIIGQCEYYRWRYDNFKSRHIDCGHEPPDYYLDYGEHYCCLFQNFLRSRLTDKGQQWLDKAKKNLQIAMEKGLILNPKVELNNEEFRKFAFATHADAYWNAGFHDIPILDKLLIGKTGMKEWCRRETWTQAGEVAMKDITAYFNEYCEFVSPDVWKYQY